MENVCFSVTLTNGTRNRIYDVWASNESEAVILAQAEAITLGFGYKLVGIELR